jgi:hypothetical protein
MTERKRKPASELTDDEVMTRVFPKPARDALKRIAHSQDRRSGKKEPSQEDDR